jgi:hypothetical protein
LRRGVRSVKEGGPKSRSRDRIRAAVGCECSLYPCYPSRSARDLAELRSSGATRILQRARELNVDSRQQCTNRCGNQDSRTLLRRDPYATSNLVSSSRGKRLLVPALRLFFCERCPGKCGLEHASGANVSVAAASLLIALVHPSRFLLKRVPSRTIKKYDSGNVEALVKLKMPDPVRSLGRGTRKCA